MGFPSLITSLCARQGVQVTATEPIKKPITKKYIQQNCKEDTVEPQGHQPPVSPTFSGRTGAAGPSGFGDEDTTTDEELFFPAFVNMSATVYFNFALCV
ncbi:hypothetical protein Lal_00014694 [Lupinus albus]|nr:hypothetical protein Lal_00014694 [Lupinus albus]